MSAATPPAQQSALLSLLVSGLLTVFVAIGGAATYYATQPDGQDGARRLLRHELARLSRHTSPAAFARIEVVVLDQSAALLRPLVACMGAADSEMTIARSGSDALRGQVEKLLPMVPLSLLRLMQLALALPLIAALGLCGVLEGLWRRDGIAVTTGYSSAAGFSAGKGLGLMALLLLLVYVFLPATLPIGMVMSALLALAPGGAFLLARNLPLHI